MNKKIITIKWDAQDKANAGWAYDIRDGESGEINRQAADAVDRICENMEAIDGDYDAIKEATGAEAGDQLWLDLSGNSQIDLAALMGMDE